MVQLAEVAWATATASLLLVPVPLLQRAVALCSPQEKQKKTVGCCRRTGLLVWLLPLLYLLLATAALPVLVVQWAAPSYYSALHVSSAASAAELKRAYHQRLLSVHPDKNSAPSAITDFLRLQAMFRTLSDPFARLRYDRIGEQHSYGEGRAQDKRTAAGGKQSPWHWLLNAAYYACLAPLLICWRLRGEQYKRGRWACWLWLLTVAVLQLYLSSASLPQWLPWLLPTAVPFQMALSLQCSLVLVVHASHLQPSLSSPTAPHNKREGNEAALYSELLSKLTAIEERLSALERSPDAQASPCLSITASDPLVQRSDGGCSQRRSSGRAAHRTRD
jgi:hypothetical protein